MIRFCFYKWCVRDNLEVVEVGSYKEFFEFFLKNNEKGCIFDVKDDGNTK